jgi:hypothetical protein
MWTGPISANRESTTYDAPTPGFARSLSCKFCIVYRALLCGKLRFDRVNPA